MKESEAKLNMAKKISNRQKVFCPMINSTCRTDCESFVEPEIYKVTDNIDSYQVDGGYCDASCLHSIGD